VWVCAYRVLLAAVDEVELDEENQESQSSWISVDLGEVRDADASCFG
jgi:hypothetical protein